MSDYHMPGAGSPYTFYNNTDIDMEDAVDHSLVLEGQYQFMQQHPAPFARNPIEYPNQSFSRGPAANPGFQRPHYAHHLSVSTQSSMSSNSRSSDNSIFSQFQNRASTVSTDSSISGISNLSRNHYLSQAEFALTGHSSPYSSYAPSPIEEAVLQPPRRRTAARTPAQEKDYYKTCASRKQRARRSHTAQKYFCTICKEPFGEKADWKRHEETYQERPEEFQCDCCPAKYFLDRDFVHHHVHGHGCYPCSTHTKRAEKKHAREARRTRTTRSGWGCGFCYHFSNDWTERCNHVAHHFEHEGKTMADWNHSVVIYSLLQRPPLLHVWEKLVASKKRHFVGFGWDVRSTARVEGYPDSTRVLQLQDELEFFSAENDAAALAHRAFDLAVKKVARDAPGSAEAEVPPPVPPKDYRLNHKASLQDVRRKPESWTQFVESVVQDEFLPTGVTELESGLLDGGMGAL